MGHELDYQTYTTVELNPVKYSQKGLENTLIQCTNIRPVPQQFKILCMRTLWMTRNTCGVCFWAILRGLHVSHFENFFPNFSHILQKEVVYTEFLPVETN